MKKITIIIPIHRLDYDYELMLIKAIKSVEPFYEDVILYIIHPNSIYGDLEKIDLGQKLEIKLIPNALKTDFCSQINKGILNCKTEWFSILEVDDEYRPVWLRSMTEYVTEYPDVDVFLPIVRDVNIAGEFLGFTNEANWAYGFTENQGFLDNNVLLEFQNYQTSGALYRTEVIKDKGLFKDKFKLTFSYELFLRLTHNGIKIMTVPRIGYQHTNFREDSLFWNYRNDEKTKLSEKEVKFWIESAKKEYFFTNNREINYVE